MVMPIEVAEADLMATTIIADGIGLFERHPLTRQPSDFTAVPVGVRAYTVIAATRCGILCGGAID